MVMMTASIFAVIAAVGLGALMVPTPVAGSTPSSYVTTVRYNSCYGKYKRSTGFQNNPVNRGIWNNQGRVGALYPSSEQTALLSKLDFPSKQRHEETRIFTGIMRVPSCRAGVYRFRVRSDDDLDMFVDHKSVLSDPGRHSTTTKEVTVELKPNTDHQFELWWANYGGYSLLQVEVCFSSAATFQAKQARADALSTTDGSEPQLSDLDLLSHLEDTSCEWTTDLSKVFVRHDEIGILRCDYHGYFHNAINANGSLSLRPSADWMTQPCAVQGGGMIDMRLAKDASHQTFTYSMNIMARATGTHTFWLWSDDASALYVDGVRIVENLGTHKGRSSMGKIMLRAGSKHEIKVYYGNFKKGGILQVHWHDPLEKVAQSNFQPLLIPLFDS